MRGLVTLSIGFLALACASTSPRVHPAAPPGTPVAAASAPAPASEYDVASSDGASIHVWTKGPAGAPPVVVLHGGPGLSHDYMAGLDALADADMGGFRVVQYDQRGTGRSARAPLEDGKPDPAWLTLAAYLADLAAVRASLGEPVHLVGHSWGGLLAQEYALAHPGELLSLTLVDSVPPTSPSFEAGTERFGARVKDLVGQGLVPADRPKAKDGSCAEGIRAVLPAYMSDPRDARVTGVPIGCAAGVNRATLEQLPDFDRRAALGALRVPALVLFGADDPFGVAWADETAAALGSQARRVVFPRAGHFPWIEARDAFFGELRAFLESHARSRP